MMNESIYSLSKSKNENTVISKQPELKKIQSKKQKSTKPKMHINSIQIESILNPIKGYRDALKKQGIERTNHSKQNIKAIKKMSELNALKKQQELEDNNNRPGSSQLKIKKNPNKVIDGKCDFLVKNIIEASSKKPILKKEEKIEPAYIKKDGYGEVPKYLQMRKIELAKAYAEKQSAKEASLLPEGMRLLEDTERKEALETVIKNKKEIEDRLKSLPLVIETPSLLSLKNNLERRLNELEDAEKLFSRQKVLVKA